MLSLVSLFSFLSFFIMWIYISVYYEILQVVDRFWAADGCSNTGHARPQMMPGHAMKCHQIVGKLVRHLMAMP